MKPFLTSFFGVICGTCTLNAFQDIPSAQPLDEEEGPLVANPQQDSLQMAGMLVQQAQQMKDNPEEFQRMMRLAADQYLEYSILDFFLGIKES